MAFVDDHAEPGRAFALGDAFDGARDEALEFGDARNRRTGRRRQRFELAAMVEREHVQRRARPARRRRPVQVRDTFIVVGAAYGRRAAEVFVELHARGHRGRAAVTADDECAAGVAELRAARPRLPLQPAREQPGQERIAGAEHVLDFDGKPGRLPCRVPWLVHHAARGAALEDDDGGRAVVDRTQRRGGVLAAAGDPDLFFGADDQVAVRQALLQR